MRLAVITIILSFLLVPWVMASESASRVLIVYNANYSIDSDGDGVQDSLEVANYYAAVRGVASNHVLPVHTKVAESSSYTSFSELSTDILKPIQSKLNSLGPTNIDIIVLCYGLPYNLSASPTVSIDNVISSIAWSLDNRAQIQINNPYFETNPLFDQHKKGHFSHSLYYFVDSYLKKDPIYLVTRLDGPLGVSGVLDMIDRGLYAEKYVTTKQGYFTGIGYIDSQGGYPGCTYTDAGLSTCSLVREGDWSDRDGIDTNIAFGERYVKNAGLALKWQARGSIIGTEGLKYSDGSNAAVAPNALLYSGWYAYNRYQYAAWQWLPGAVGVDYDSSSLAYPIESPYVPAWGIQALNHGITATCGNVAEPGVGGAHSTSILLYYLLQGYTFAEASELANPFLGGSQTMCIGDPLYAPFAPKTAIVDNTTPVFRTRPVLKQTSANGVVVTGIINTTVVQPSIATFTLGYGTRKPSNFSQWSQQVVNSGGYTRRFSIQALNLKPNTTYYYQVQAQGPLPKYRAALSPIGSFTTPRETSYTTLPVPGTIAISNFDEGEDGVSWYAVQPQRSSGQRIRTDAEFPFDTSGNLLHAYAGQWMNYTVTVTEPGAHEIDLIACDCYNTSVGSTFHVELDGKNVTSAMKMPKFGGKYGTIVMGKGVSFSAGTHVLTLVMDAGPPGPDPMAALFSDMGKFQAIVVK